VESEIQERMTIVIVPRVARGVPRPDLGISLPID
jgi:hypothetical protein